MIDRVTDETIDEVRAFLAPRRNTCLFLLAGLDEHGPDMTDHINSGNMKCLRDEDGAIRVVFSLIRRGHLLVQDDGAGPWTSVDLEAIVNACRDEPVDIVGVVGPWPFAREVWEAARRREPALREVYRSREVLYELPLAPVRAADPPPPDPSVRRAVAGDFEARERLTALWCGEDALPVTGTVEQRRRNFEERVARGDEWGRQDAGVLVSMAVLIARHDDTAVIGGVYTDPAHRRRGYSRAVMQRLVEDSARVHHLERLILFTGEENTPARKLYESLGFSRIGWFGLLFGERHGSEAPPGS